MAKKKGQAAKTFPKVGQEWKETSGKVDHYLLITATGRDENHKQTWECEDESEGDDGQKVLTMRTLYLADFQEAFIQCIGDPEEAAKTPGPVQEIRLVPIKNGFTFKCPSPECGDTHDEENEMGWSEVVAAHDRFRKRHEAHLDAGSLWGAKL